MLNECYLMLKKGKIWSKTIDNLPLLHAGSSVWETIKMILWNTPQSNIKRDNRQLRWKWSEEKWRKMLFLPPKHIASHAFGFIAFYLIELQKQRKETLKKFKKIPHTTFKLSRNFCNLHRLFKNSPTEISKICTEKK